MNRSIKILVALSCFILGCVLTMDTDLLPSGESFLNPIFQALGFTLIFVAGLYSFLKMIRPFFYEGPIGSGCHGNASSSITEIAK
jgi:hypothetical protein